MWPSSMKTRIKYPLLIWLVQVKTVWIQSMKMSKTCIRDQRETTKAQCNDNPNRYWLRRRRHETRDKPNWTTDIKGEENKSDIKRNSEDNTI